MNSLRFIQFLLLCTVGFASCHKALQPSALVYQHYGITASAKQDTALLSLIEPYRNAVDKSMNAEIGIAAETLEKKQPSGSLGNFMADAVLAMARKQFNTSVDFSIINYGGIRSNQLPKGSITLGKVFELMPFDNLMVLQKLSAAQVQQLADHIAGRGGWPVAGLSFTISNKKAVDVRVSGQSLQQDKIYTLANSDYVANGGDDAFFLKPLPQINSGFLIRDALVGYIKEEQGKPIEANNEKRIRHAE